MPRKKLSLPEEVDLWSILRLLGNWPSLNPWSVLTRWTGRSRWWAVLFTLLAGGGVGGWVEPNLPLLGPLVAQLTQLLASAGPSGARVANALHQQIAELRSRAEQRTGVKVRSWREVSRESVAEQEAAEELAKAASPNGSPPAGMSSPASPTGASGGRSPGVGAGSVSGNAGLGGVAGGLRPGPSTRPVASTTKPVDRIAIATHNLQVFGTSKLAKPMVLDALVFIARQFDVLALQEIRAKDDQVLPRLVAAINADGSRYDYVIGPRQGRTSTVEQYAFVYDTTRIEVNPQSAGLVDDPADVMHREPLIAQFRTRALGPERAFSFWLINVHTDPDDVPRELDGLANVFLSMRGNFSSEDDVILLGDFNADERRMGRLAQVPQMVMVARGTTTNTQRTRAYDNILFDGQATTEFTGRWGVVDLQQGFGLNLAQAREISDHCPVWAEFSAMEAGRGH